MKLLQIVWNFPDTGMQPFNMYYFYWPARAAILRGWQSGVLTIQVNNHQPAEEVIDGIRVRGWECVRGGRSPGLSSMYSSTPALISSTVTAMEKGAANWPSC
jgi:hypothetical protein